MAGGPTGPPGNYQAAWRPGSPLVECNAPPDTVYLILDVVLAANRLTDTEKITRKYITNSINIKQLHIRYKTSYADLP